MEMKRLVALLLAGFLCAAPASAQPQPAPIHPALFVMRDADSTIYLFGTIHVRRPGAAWGGQEAQAALAQSQTLRTELEMSPAADARAQSDAMRLGLAGPNDPLSSHLTAAQRVRVAAALKRMQAPQNMLEGMRPWFAGLMLSMLPVMQAGYDVTAGVDRQIDAAADAAGLEARWFETSEQQLNFIGGLSAPLQVQMVMEGVDAVETGIGELSAMERDWERGDLDALQRLVVDDTKQEYPELYDALFAARNRAWTDVLVADMNGAGVEFVAVGAGHLLGQDGLIAMLRARGISVERVNPAAPAER